MKKLLFCLICLVLIHIGCTSDPKPILNPLSPPSSDSLEVFEYKDSTGGYLVYISRYSGKKRPPMEQITWDESQGYLERERFDEVDSIVVQMQITKAHIDSLFNENN